jgi:hypothetical protein
MMSDEINILVWCELKTTQFACRLSHWDVDKCVILDDKADYAHMTDTPAWVQGRVAVLNMLDANSEFVEGVGQRVGGYTFWLVPDTDYEDISREELLSMVITAGQRKAKLFAMNENYRNEIETERHRNEIEIKQYKAKERYDFAIQSKTQLGQAASQMRGLQGQGMTQAGLRADLINNVKAQGVMIKSAQTPPLTPFPYGEAAEEKQSWIDKVFRR